MVETEGPKSDLVAPVLPDSDSTDPLSVSDKLSAGLFSLVCANCSGSFSEDSLIFLNISSQVLTLSLGLEPDIFILQANSPTTVLLTVNDKLVNISIHFYIQMLKSV
jgi:hypothetical protein